MKRFPLLLAALLLLIPRAFSDFQEIIAQADELHEQEAYEEGERFLRSSMKQAGSKAEEAELYWRLARVYLNLGDEAEDQSVSKKEILAFFEEGENLAEKAIELDPANHLGYYWKSGNIGRWGQIKGILNSLFKAGPMKGVLEKAVSLEPDHADSFYVLGQLYEQLPGFPISFGNKDHAVSLGRKSIDLHTEQVKAGFEDEYNYDFFTELAKHLYERKWKASKRFKEQKEKISRYQSYSEILKKNFYYEGIVTLKNISDRQEAEELIAWVIRELESIPNRDADQDGDLKEAREVQESWK